MGFGLTAIDTRIARSVGGFPLVDRGEDSAFCIRLSEAGYKCRQVEDRVYGVHYKSDHAVLPPEPEWPCPNFDDVVMAVADADAGSVIAALGAVDPHQMRDVVAQALEYGLAHQLRKRRALILD